MAGQVLDFTLTKEQINIEKTKEKKENEKNFKAVKKEYPALVQSLVEQCIKDGKMEGYEYKIDFSNSVDGLVNSTYEHNNLEEEKYGFNRLYQNNLISNLKIDTSPISMGSRANKIICTISKELMRLLLN